MEMRVATSDDADLIYEIKYQAYAEYSVLAYGSWDESFQRGYTHQNLPYTNIIIVDSNPVGWIACKEDDEKLEILDLHILPSYQRSLLGTEALSEILHSADRQQKDVELGVLKVNPSRALYERLGFHATSENSTHILMKREPNKPLIF